MLFCFCNCIFVTVRVSPCTGTCLLCIPLNSLIMIIINDTYIHTGKEKGPRLRATQLAETQVAGSLATQKKTIHCLSV